MGVDDIDKEVGKIKNRKGSSYFNIKGLGRTEKEHQLLGGKSRI